MEWFPAELVGAVDAEAVPEPKPGVGPEPVIVLWNGVLRAGAGEESLAVRGCMLSEGVLLFVLCSVLWSGSIFEVLHLGINVA